MTLKVIYSRDTHQRGIIVKYTKTGKYDICQCIATWGRPTQHSFSDSGML